MLKEDRLNTRTLHLVVWVFLVLLYGFASYVQYEPYHFLRGDGAFYAQIVRSIVKYHTLRQEEVQPSSWYTKDLGWNNTFRDSWSDISVGKDGEWYPKHPILMPIVAVPFYLAFGTVGFLIFSILTASLGMYFSFRAAARLSSSLPALLAVLLFAPFHIMTYNTYGFRNDIFYSTLVMGAVAFALEERMLLAGAFAGLAFFAKFTNLLVLIPVLLPLLVGTSKRKIRDFVISFSIPVGLWGLVNWWMFGAPWITSYQRVLVREQGIQRIATHTNDFTFPFWQGLRRLLWDRLQGLFFIGPTFIVGILGEFSLYRRHRRLALGILVALIAFFAFHAKYIYLWGRFFIPWYELLVIPAAALLSDALGLVDALISKGFGVRHVLAGLLVGLLVIAGGRGVYLFLEPRDMYRDVEHLTVTLGSIPCDYFNMADDKWECSHFDHGWRHFTGRALDGQCNLKGGSRFIIIPSDSKRTRKVLWRPQEPLKGPVEVHLGRDWDSRKGSYTITLRLNDKPYPLQLPPPGSSKLLILNPGYPVREVLIEVPPANRIWTCINVMPSK